MLDFSGEEFAKVVEEALTKQCDIQLYTDNGVYLAAINGEYSDDGRVRLYVAYASGCNATDYNWQGIASKELRDADLPMVMHPHNKIIQHIYATKSDFEIFAGKYIFYTP